jgi:hypothetical protein
VCSVTREGDRLAILAVDGPAVLSPVAVALSGGHLDVRSITMRTPSLDDVFMALTDSDIKGAA